MKVLVALLLFSCTAFASADDLAVGPGGGAGALARGATAVPAGGDAGAPAELALSASPLAPDVINRDRKIQDTIAGQSSEVLALGRMVSASADRQLWATGIQSAVVGTIGLLSLFATLLLIRTLRQTAGLVAAARQSAMESRQASHQAIEHFVSDRRPWISAEAKAVSGIRWDTAGGRLTLCISVRNLGQLPATNVAVHFQAIVETAVADGDRMAKIRRLMADARAGEPSAFPGAFILFPGQERDVPCDGLIRLTDIADGSCDGDLFNPYLVGCVSYRFAGSEQIHQTAFSYLPFKRSATGAASTPLRVSDGDLPARMVGFTTDYEGGIAT